jgi:hypothetical protein
VKMGGSVARERCFNHALREAVARCPRCRRTFCRECVTEHDDRVLCAACLEALERVDPDRTGRRRFAVLSSCFGAVLALLIAWLFFYSLGRALAAVPTPFHERTLWEGTAGGGE